MKKIWRITIFVGLSIGVLNLIHFLLSTKVDGVEVPFGFFPGGVPFASLLFITGQKMSGMMKAILVLGLGIVIGSLVSSIMSKELTFKRFRKSKLQKIKVIQASLGGLLMAIGIWMANGCLIKHALTGTPGLMLSSITALFGILAGIWTANKIREIFLI